MKLNNLLRLTAGIMIIVSVLLQIFVDPRWIWLTIFIALNLVQSAFSDWCPAIALLRKLNVKE